MNIKTIDICKVDLFTDKDVLLTRYDAARVDRLMRLREMYVWAVEYPSKPEREFIRHFAQRFPLSTAQLYNDLSLVKTLVPLFAEKNKDYYRWKVSQVLETVIEKAERDGDLKTMERAASSLARVNRVEEPDPETVPYEDIVPAPFVLSADPRDAGLTPMKNKEERLRKLYRDLRLARPDIEDIDCEEADVNY